MFRQGQYRSFKNYLTTAMDHHLMDGHTSTKNLERMANKVRRAVERGQGPADQSLPLRLDLVIELLRCGLEPVVKGGMIFPKETVILGSFFMTREIELTAANLGDFTWHEEERTVVWLLPASKTDTKAKGTRRSWGCVCGSSSSALPSPCPYCASVIIRRWHVQQDCSPGVPFFCTLGGARVTKDAAVKTFRLLAEWCGQEVMHDGVFLIGGHTLRVTGAQHMAALGIEVYLIQLMGRWGWAMVMRYVAEAPLLKVTDAYRNKALGRSLHEACREKVMEISSADDDEAIQAIKRECDKLKTTMEEQAAELGMLRTMVSDDVEKLKSDLQLLSSRDIAFIKRTDIDDAKWHPVVVQHPEPPKRWRTECGWRFAGASYTSTGTSSWPDPQCNFCRRVIRRRVAKERAEEDSSTASSSGS